MNEFSEGMEFEENIQLSEEIETEKRKVISFISHFMTMVQFFEGRIKNGTLKQKLKKAWKWIKGVVVEWNQMKKENL